MSGKKPPAARAQLAPIKIDKAFLLSGDFMTHTKSTVDSGKILEGENSVVIEGWPAARVGDPFNCSKQGLSPDAHFGGSILPPGAPNVIIGGKPAARVGDWGECVKAPMAMVATGATQTFIGDAASPAPLPPQLQVSDSGWSVGNQDWLLNINAIAVVNVAAVYALAVLAEVALWKSRRVEIGTSDTLLPGPRCACGGNAADDGSEYRQSHDGVPDDAPMYFL